MPFTPLSKVLENVMREKEFTGNIAAFEIFSLWNEIAGKRLAAHAHPVRIKGSVLYVEVDDQLWRVQLLYMKQDMLNKIDRILKPGMFTDLKFLLKGL
jgi:predicted nucleic acid-binding Zn ribbon protein